MAEQSFLAKLGLRLGVLGTAGSIALAAPLANGNYDPSCHTDAARIGVYFDRTAGAEKIGYIVGGQTGPLFTRVASVVNNRYNGAFGIPSGVNPIINGAVLTQRYVFFDTANVLRLSLYANNNTESGSNAGSGPVFQAYSDLGVAGDLIFTIGRATTNGMNFIRNLVLSTSGGYNWTFSSNAGTSRTTSYNSTSGGVRWQESANGTAESGSDAGSAYTLVAFTDGGAAINTPLAVTRAALGVCTISRPVTHIGGTLTGTETLWNCTGTWSNTPNTFVGLNINITTTASAAGSLLMDLQIGNVSRFKVTCSTSASGGITAGGYTMAAVDTDLLTTGVYTLGRTTTLTVGVADGFEIIANTAISGLFTVTRMNWIELDDVTGSATVTDGTVFWFDAAAGAHKCIDSGTTKTSPGTVSSWIKHNINGTIYYSNAYTSKTS